MTKREIIFNDYTSLITEKECKLIIECLKKKQLNSSFQITKFMKLRLINFKNNITLKENSLV